VRAKLAIGDPVHRAMACQFDTMRLSTQTSLLTLVLSIACFSFGCADAPPLTLDIATTTSVQTSGLLSYLLPVFQRASGIVVRVHATGSGRALQMLSDGTVDAAISHAPETERRQLAQHPDWSYRKIAHNWFVVAGPDSDPAAVRGASDVLEAFRRIADSGQPFVSRGDESGTHERERSFWEAAGQRPAESQLIVSGRGMGQALRHADEARAYLLADEPTLRQMSGTLDLIALFKKDARLVNTYAVIHRNLNARAATFATWLTSQEGRATIASLSINGEPAFESWPAGCAGGQPGDLPCATKTQ
jgi:tungstate transport system substrate-binding protein